MKVLPNARPMSPLDVYQSMKQQQARSEVKSVPKTPLPTNSAPPPMLPPISPTILPPIVQVKVRLVDTFQQVLAKTSPDRQAIAVGAAVRQEVQSAAIEQKAARAEEAVRTAINVMKSTQPQYIAAYYAVLGAVEAAPTDEVAYVAAQAAITAADATQQAQVAARAMRAIVTAAPNEKKVEFAAKAVYAMTEGAPAAQKAAVATRAAHAAITMAPMDQKINMAVGVMFIALEAAPAAQKTEIAMSIMRSVLNATKVDQREIVKERIMGVVIGSAPELAPVMTDVIADFDKQTEAAASLKQVAAPILAPKTLAADDEKPFAAELAIYATVQAAPAPQREEIAERVVLEAMKSAPDKQKVAVTVRAVCAAVAAFPVEQKASVALRLMASVPAAGPKNIKDTLLDKMPRALVEQEADLGFAETILGPGLSAESRDLLSRIVQRAQDNPDRGNGLVKTIQEFSSRPASPTDTDSFVDNGSVEEDNASVVEHALDEVAISDENEMFRTFPQLEALRSQGPFLKKD